MAQQNGRICMYFGGACSQCVRDRFRYEKLAGKAKALVCWIDITDKKQSLQEMVIVHDKALTELHVKRILSELNAYILLLREVPLLRPPLGWLVLETAVARKLYHLMITRRLRWSGRLY